MTRTSFCGMLPIFSSNGRSPSSSHHACLPLALDGTTTSASAASPPLPPRPARPPPRPRPRTAPRLRPRPFAARACCGSVSGSGAGGILGCLSCLGACCCCCCCCYCCCCCCCRLWSSRSCARVRPPPGDGISGRPGTTGDGLLLPLPLPGVSGKGNERESERNR
jgi:hypothetical protein